VAGNLASYPGASATQALGVCACARFGLGWVWSGWTGAAFGAAFGWGFGVGLGWVVLGRVGLARGPGGFWPRSVGLGRL